VINAINNGRPAWVPVIGLDSHIPFVPQFFYFYTLYFPLVVLPLFVLPLQPHLKRHVYSNVVVMVVSYAFFLILPTKVLRVKPGNDVLTFLYHQAVAPYNLFPSLHISMLLLALLSVYSWRKNVGVALAIPILLSAASVVLTKQHYILDVFSAIPIAIASFVGVSRRVCKTKTSC
jgi:hypothetical protein